MTTISCVHFINDCVLIAKNTESIYESMLNGQRKQAVSFMNEYNEGREDFGEWMFFDANSMLELSNTFGILE